MAKPGDIIVLRIKHPLTYGTVPGVTFRVVKVAYTREGCPTGYWPYPSAPFYACAGAAAVDFSELLAVQDRAQRYWRVLLKGHFADFCTSRSAFDAITGYRLRKHNLRHAV